MHQTTWRATSTTESENRQTELVQQNEEKTQIMINSNECTHECTILSAQNRKK